MNARVAFDTHAFVKRLEAAGLSVAHAEALADAMGDIVLQSVATKTDLKEVELGLRSELNELRKELKELELRLTLRMLGMTTATIAILAALKILG
ncbi:MAG: coiled-coil domain-containing protein [Allosphingosinicella sp.]